MLGNCAAKRLELRVQRLDLLERFCMAVSAELRYLLPPVGTLLRTLAGRECFAELSFLQDAAEHTEAFPNGWRKAVAADRHLREEERAVLQTVGDTLGQMDAEGQLAALGLCAERLREMRETAARQMQGRGQMYRSMGILGGIFLVILLI